MKLRYGTRGSPLALAQSDWFAGCLRERHPGLEVERVVIQTSGDRFSLAQPQAPAQAGGDNVKAMFVKEIEEALLAATIDFAVHSSKDLPGELPAGLAIAAFPRREDPRDVFIGRSGVRWKDVGTGFRLATASLRRRLQLGLAVPGLSFVAMRGNVDTRLRKLEQGQADGLVLAMAGLKRLGLTSVVHEPLPVELVVPAPGQGALAIEAQQPRRDVVDLLGALDDAETRLEVECERAFLRLMEGGCRTPLGGLAKREGSGMRFDWFWSDDNGANPRKGSFSCAADPAAFEAAAGRLAESLRRGGAGAL